MDLGSSAGAITIGISFHMAKRLFRLLKHYARRTAESLPINFYQRLLPRDFISIYYHILSDQQLSHVSHLYDFKTPEMFESDLCYLSRYFTPISYDQLVVSLSTHTKLPPKAVLLTFDDGFKECFTVARPLLLKYGIPCIFFVATQLLDNRELPTDLKISICIDQAQKLDSPALISVLRQINSEFDTELLDLMQFNLWAKGLITNDHRPSDRLLRILGVDEKSYLAEKQPYLTTQQVLQLHQEGFHIGSHSRRHEHFPELSPAEIMNNISISCQSISNLTGQSQTPFAFPFSADGIQRELLKQIREEHSAVGLMFDGHGVEKQSDFLFSRMCGDSPKGSRPGISNLEVRIRNAYLEEISRALHSRKP